jgi:hypothetical protein
MDKAPLSVDDINDRARTLSDLVVAGSPGLEQYAAAS